MNQIVDRRSPVTATAAIPAVAFPMTAKVAAGVSSDFSAIEAKIAVHLSARAAEHVAYEELRRLEIDNPLPCPKVQYGKLHVGRDADGEDQFEPLYAYTAEAIEREREKHARSIRSLWSRHPGFSNMLAKLDVRYDSLVEDLGRQEASRRAVQDACGITAADGKADRCVNASEEARLAIVHHEFTSLAELRLAVLHIAECVSQDCGDLAENDIADEVGQLVLAALRISPLAA